MKKTIMMMHQPKEVAYEILKDYNIIFGTSKDDDFEMKLKKADYLVTSLDFPVNKEFIEKYPNIRLYNNFAVGHDNLNKEDGKNGNVTMCNCPDCVTIPTAELTFTLMLAAARKLVLSHHKAITTACYDKAGTEGFDITGKTIGIIGLGAIGKQVAKYLSGFDCKFIYNKQSGQDREFEEKYDAMFATVDYLVSHSDIVTLHCPLTPDTTNLINKELLKTMKPTSLLINVARGKVVNTDDLVEALEKGYIAGAGLDVFEDEPNIDTRLQNSQKVTLTPHIGGNTVETKVRLYNKVKQNIKAFEANDVPVGKVN